MPAGRPTKYNQKIAAEICEWLSSGRSLRAYCRQIGTPDLSTITRWIVRDDQFRNQYAQAREAAGHAQADEILELANEIRSGELEPQAAKIIMDALKWSAERMAPKSYGPKQALDHTSSDGSMTPQVIERVIVHPDGNGES